MGLERTNTIALERAKKRPDTVGEPPAVRSARMERSPWANILRTIWLEEKIAIKGLHGPRPGSPGAVPGTCVGVLHGRRPMGQEAGRRPCGEARGARLRPGALVEPAGHPVHSDGGGDRHMWQVGLGQSTIPGTTEPTGAYAR